jgi:hypothetical protein
MAPTEDNKPREKAAAAAVPRVRWDDSNMSSSYANVVNATSSREEVTLFFGTNQTWNASDDEYTVQLTERIILNPFATKRLNLLLGSVLKEYESRYGVLEIEADKLQKK